MTESTAITASPALITGVFMDRDSAERAYSAITRRGYDKSEISLVIDDDVRERYFPAARESDSGLADKAAESGDLGGPLGATLGTVFTAVAAVGTFLLLPGLGLAAAGPIAAALAGAGTAAVAGGLVGALHDWGIPQDRVDEYEAALKAGGILLGVKPRDAEDREAIEAEWKTIGAERVQA